MDNILQQYEEAIKITQWSNEAKILLANPKGVICADTETTGLLFHTPSYLWDEQRWVDDPFPFGISLSFLHEGRMVLVWGRLGTKLYDECVRLLASPNIKTWHNCKYDRRVCKVNGLGLNGPQNCTLTMSRIYWDRREAHGLQELSEFLCPELSGWEVDFKKEITKLKTYWTRKVKKDNIWLPPGMKPNEYFNYSFITDSKIGKYSMVDAFFGFQLYKKLMPIMVDEYWDLYRRERDVIDICIKIEEIGMRWDVERGKKEIEEHEKKIVAEWEVIQSLAGEGFTFYAPKIVAVLKKLGVKEKQLKDKGKVTTGADVLRRCLNDGVPELAVS